jgi:Ca-activated chloride channel family protein
MHARPVHLIAVTTLAFLFAAPAAFGQTVIIDRTVIPMPPDIQPPPRHRRPPAPMRDSCMKVEKHAVHTTITDGTAVTQIEQIFRNQYPHRIEGTYIFPLPDDVAISKFSMTINGQEVEGQLLDVDQARKTYEAIVASMRDPALLEYIGRKMFKASIFPIDPGQDVKIKLSYTQLLKTEDGLVRYRYPLKSDRYLTSPITDVSVLVTIENKTAIKSVFSPSHGVAIGRPGDHKASASFEGKNLAPDRDFELMYTLSDKEFGMTVLTHRQPGEDGYFLLRVAPPAEIKAGEVLPKDVCFVVDTSGSMAGEKMEQARAALKFCLASLNREDRFNVIPFSHEAVRFENALVAATPENVERARAFADQLKANGGTNIHDALMAAVDVAGTETAATKTEGSAEPAPTTGRPYLMVFLTDGQPTIGVTDINEILQAARTKVAARARLFVFGVGHDVNTRLLDTLADQNRGVPDYVEPGENLEMRLSSFYRKVADPVLTGLELKFGDLRVYDMFPPKLGDLFGGSELVITGRYSGEGARAIELTGTRRGTRERFMYETTFPAEAKSHEFLPPLWAVRKVGYLLDEIRLKGENQELKDSIVELATKYGIVTPYTAYLVTEPGQQVSVGGAWRRDAFNASQPTPATPAMAARARRAPAPGPGMAGGGRAAPAEVGQAAVQQSKDIVALKSVGYVGGDDAESLKDDDAFRERVAKKSVHRVGTRTFYFVDKKWVDSAYDGKAETQKVELYSAAYFDLLKAKPALGPIFALGERVIVVFEGTVYETVPPPPAEGDGEE